MDGPEHFGFMLSIAQRIMNGKQARTDCWEGQRLTSLSGGIAPTRCPQESQRGVRQIPQEPPQEKPTIQQELPARIFANRIFKVNIGGTYC